MQRSVTKPAGQQDLRSRLSEGARVAAAATGLTLLMAVVKGVLGYSRGSPALTADAIHSGADTLAIFASWVGLRLAARPPTKRFPFGLYRAETLASLLVSAVIFTAGVGLLMGSLAGLLHGESPVHRNVEVLVVALVSAVLSFGIFSWERRVGSRLNSQSLLANADESRTDIMTSLAVFVGTGATYLGVARIELFVTAALSLLVVWLGLKHGRTAVYALLDASLDPELERQAVSIAKQVPGVMHVEQIRLRRSGPFCFGIAHIHLRRSVDVGRAHDVAHQVVRSVTEAVPQVETLTVHLEPFLPERQIVVVPADGKSTDASVSAHFGRAAFFTLTRVSSQGLGEIEFIENTARSKPARAGLAAIKEILESRKVDAVLTREMGEIAFHTLRDQYIDIYAAPDGSVTNALTRFATEGLPPLEEPTHASEAAGSPKGSGEAG